jgi:hypothetical protein
MACLARASEHQAHTRRRTEVTLPDSADGDYDPDVNERLGFEWDAAPDTNASDSSQMIVLVDDKRVVSTSQLRFDDIDLCTDVWPLLPSDTGLQFTQPANHVWHATF